MHRLTYKMIVLAVFLALNSALAASDPCDPSVYKSIHDSDKRGERCELDPEIRICDRYIEKAWYRVDNDNGPLEMLTKCPDDYSCGTRFPIWMNDSHPTTNEDVVNRTACVHKVNSCCDINYDIKVKNCSSFYVYYLVDTDYCPEGYCFGKNLSCPLPALPDPCDAENHQIVSVQDVRSTYCENKQTLKCGSNLIEGWYKLEDQTHNFAMAKSCVKQNQCNTVWLNGSDPTVSEKVVLRNGCVNTKESCCEQAFQIQIKNCSTYLVYYLDLATSCPLVCNIVDMYDQCSGGAKKEQFMYGIMFLTLLTRSLVY